ncbi:hypothetical protein VitviT2T_007859 [Vitis vinifera]|uniref:Alpha-L-arabinofuranosidase B arabinose-binding domain-containing protein n=2 Tax=Vitis vinifera TaxID=29760 RepID=F6GU88_VITVI|nr:uncharacterized protein LOC100246702 [Vitis vinifera]WJZ88577.1 hypothetical protein VitviT2T_007859 [Vitis vinifera]|eukprot:XP_002285548.1 PREDICTED: uncharacterized protein LOC100246702 [Vitis vinifera]
MKVFVLSEVLIVVFAFVLCGCVLGKECTNVPTQLSSHSFRYELLASNNESWKAEMFQHYHLIHTDDSAWSNLLPRKLLREEDEFSWAMMYRNMKNYDGSNSNFLKEMSLHDVRLDSDSLHGRAQQTNLDYLLILDVDRLVWSFRKTAGLSTPGLPYGGWEAPNVELRGHFVGHYMSASAQMWASTHNDTLKEKMSAVVSALATCQEKMGTGYLSAFPSELFDRFEAIKPVWAPYYTIHKILAGLLDQYTFAGNSQALKMMTWMVEHFYKRVQNVITMYSLERHWLSLNEETGGMNDVLYRLYSITGDQKHLVLAHLFDKPCFLGLLAVQADSISGFHANTHIPVVIGSQMRYEVTGDPLYKAIGTFFMDIVNSSHSYATGGTSVGEFWSDPKRLASTLQRENEESCTTYNMLKVSRHLFRWTKEVVYADYYERALTNGVLSIQRGTDPGVMIYMLPLGRGDSKARSYHGWGTKFDSFWCCYGTGIESFSKLGDSIYFEEEGKSPEVYIIQYISSSLDWKSGQIVLNQKVDPVVSWDPYLRTTLTFTPKEGAGQSSTINLRIPVWASSSGAKASINAQDLPVPAPSSFLSLTRNWSPGDKLTLQLPIRLRTEAIKDDRPKYASIQAILYGPYLLAGLTSDDWDIKTGSATSLSDWITPIPASDNSRLVSLSQESGNSSFVFSNSNQSITMEKFPEEGTDASLHATFRLVLKDATSLKVLSPKDAIGKSVMLEPIDLPGMVVVQQGTNQNLGIANSAAGKGSLFHLVAGLDGKDGTVSLESESQKDCYVYSGIDYNSGTSIKLKSLSESGSSDEDFNKATSFILKEGISQYHPISFVAKGMKRNFLLTPLLGLRDESYTVYFNIQD